MLPAPGFMIAGSKKAMNGRLSSPMKAVNKRNTATSLCLKYLSTRYLSKCVETAHRTGPEKANRSQVIGRDSANGGGQPQTEKAGASEKKAGQRQMLTFRPLRAVRGAYNRPFVGRNFASVAPRVRSAAGELGRSSCA